MSLTEVSVTEVQERFQKAITREGLHNYTYGLLNSIKDGTNSLLSKERAKNLEKAIIQNKERLTKKKTTFWWNN